MTSRETGPFRGLSAVRLAAGSLLWTGTAAASAALQLYWDGWETLSAALRVVVLFAAGAALAFAPAMLVASLLPQRPLARFAAAFVMLTVLTIGATVALYAFQYRIYYSEWHGAPFSEIWMHQILFTTLAAIYQFAVIGLRLYFPLGFAGLFVAAVWFARLPR